MDETPLHVHRFLMDNTYTSIMILLILFCNLLLIRYFIPLHGVTRHQSSMIYRINPYQYVHDAFRSHNYTTINKWTSKEPSFVPISYELKGLGARCKSGTFSLITYYIPLYHILVTGHPYHIRTPR